MTIILTDKERAYIANGVAQRMVQSPHIRNDVNEQRQVAAGYLEQVLGFRLRKTSIQTAIDAAVQEKCDMETSVLAGTPDITS